MNTSMLPRFSAIAIVAAALSGSVIAQDTHLSFPGKNGPGKGKRVVLIAGDEEYRSEESMPMLGKILSQRHGFDCDVLFSAEADGTINPKKGDSLTHPESLEKADAVVLATRFRKWDDATMAKFEAAVNRGVALVALRTATHPFNGLKGTYERYNFNAKGDWQGGFGRHVLGETWVAHHGAHKKEGCRTVPVATDEPILRGVGTIFADSDVYTAKPQADAKVLLNAQVTATLDPASPAVEGKKNDPLQPVAWTRLFKNEAGKTNRVLTTTMGAASDLSDENLRRLVVNGVFWGLDLDVPAKADVTVVDEWNPSFYGFGEHRAGLKVADHALGKPLPKRTDGKDTMDVRAKSK